MSQLTLIQPWFAIYKRLCPEALNHGYIAWIHGRWAEYRSEHGLRRDAPITEEMQADFTAWLDAQVPR